MSLSWEISEPKEDAHPWVYSTYLRGYLTATSLAKLVPSKVYYGVMHDACKEALSRYRLIVAAPPESDGQFFGWALGRPGLVWYVHVKPLYRRQGIASDLVRKLSGDCRHCEIAHVTSSGQELMNSLRGRVWHFRQ